MSSARSLFLAGLALVLFGATSSAALPTNQKTDGPVSYYRDVRRIFQQHCQGCHQPAKAQGGYVMTSYADLLKPGERGVPVVVAGQPGKSSLVEQILPKDGKRAAMPKGKDSLATRDIDLIKRWISEGAKDDTPKTARVVIDASHPPVYKSPPVVTALDYSPDGKLLAVAGFHEVLLHKVEAAPNNAPAARLIGLAERIQSLAFSPDGKQLAVAGGSPGRFGEIQVWDVAKRKLQYSVSVTFDTVYGISWSPDGSKLAFGCSDNTVRALDAATGKQIVYQGAHSDWVLGTTFSQDSEHIVSISRDMSMKLTVVSTQRFVDNITSITPGVLKGGLLAVARRPQAKQTKVKCVDGKERIYDEVIIGGSDGTPRLYKIHRVVQRVIGDDANRVREFQPLPGRIFALSFSKDGNLFAAGSSLNGQGEVRVYQTGDGKLVSKLECKTSGVYTVAFRADGKQVASAGFDGVVRLSDPMTGKIVREFLPVRLSAAPARAPVGGAKR